MANLDTATAGSIAEHDIILSISEEAINRQFNLLYNKPIPVANGLPPPPGLKLSSGATTVPSKYFINHELQVFKQYTDEETKQISFDPEAGIFAHVTCPHISLKEDELNTARVSFTFERVEGAQTPDSEFRYYVGKIGNAKLKSRIINGWTMSWKVRIGERKFGDVQHVVAHPDLVKALTGIKPTEFTVAAIFCIFEDVLLANSFELKDEKGEKSSEGANELMNDISCYFKGVQDATSKGVPTADNPFVLGYSLSQNAPDLQSINPDVKTDKTPKYFIPKGYQMTTTPGYVYEGGQRKNSKYTNGTLNFCMLTFRDPRENSRDPAKIDMKQNANSGKLSQTLFDLTKTSDNDGIMVFAEDLMLQKFLGPLLASKYAIDVEDVKKGLDSNLKKSCEIKTTEKQGPRNSPSYQRKTEFNIKGGKENILFDDKCETKGHVLTKITWESELQTNKNIEAKDAIRKIYITVHNEIKINTTYVDVGAIIDDNYEYHYDIAMKYVWEISAGKGGVLDIQKNDSKAILPKRDSEGKIEWTDGTRGSESYGAYRSTNNDKNGVWEVFKFVETHGVSWFISKMVEAAQNTLSNSLTESISKAVTENTTQTVDSLRNRVIMPAGNVFNFSGVDTDSQGNMLVHVSFALGAEGVEQEKGKKPGPTG